MPNSKKKRISFIPVNIKLSCLACLPSNKCHPSQVNNRDHLDPFPLLYDVPPGGSTALMKLDCPASEIPALSVSVT